MYIRPAQHPGVILDLSSLQNCFSSLIFLGRVLNGSLEVIPQHLCWVEVWAWLGHSKRRILCLRSHSVVDLIHCLGLLPSFFWASACGQPPWDYPIGYPDKLGNSFSPPQWQAVQVQRQQSSPNHDAPSTILQWWDDVFMLLFSFYAIHAACSSQTILFVHKTLFQ